MKEALCVIGAIFLGFVLYALVMCLLFLLVLFANDGDLFDETVLYLQMIVGGTMFVIVFALYVIGLA